jgi:hypothetical protein
MSQPVIIATPKSLFIAARNSAFPRLAPPPNQPAAIRPAAAAQGAAA